MGHYTCNRFSPDPIAGYETLMKGVCAPIGVVTIDILVYETSNITFPRVTVVIIVLSAIEE